MTTTPLTRMLCLLPIALLLGCQQSTSSPCYTQAISNAVLVELGIATFDPVDGVKPISPFEHALKAQEEQGASPKRVVCSGDLTLSGINEHVIIAMGIALGDLGNRFVNSFAGIEQRVINEINALAREYPDQYVSEREIPDLGAIQDELVSRSNTMSLPVRYAVNPTAPDQLLGLKLGDDALGQLSQQFYLLYVDVYSKHSRQAAEGAARAAKAAGFDSVAEYRAAKQARDNAVADLAKLQEQLAAANRAESSQAGQLEAAERALKKAQSAHDKASAEYRAFMSAVKAGNSSSHPDLLRFSDLRLEKGDRGRVKLKGSVTNASRKALNRWVSDVYMYRPDLDRVFVAVGHSFSFYWTGKKINPGETKPIDEWIVGFNTLDRGGNTKEKVFRDVKPATVHMAHTKIIDVDKNNVIPPVKNSTDYRRVMEQPDKALREAKSSLATAKQRLASTRQEIESLTAKVEVAKDAVEATALQTGP